MEKKIPFEHFGVMFDCSRNAVIRPEVLEKWVDLLADLGYNSLYLYTEDTYEVENEPYFGYLRGRYSMEELRRVDQYAASKGVQLIPCIQTLAHLATAIRWSEYQWHVDIDDILLAEDDRVYELIENMFRTLSKTISGKIVNVGMDEAHLLGRGKYYDLHGEQDRFSILLKHLERVAAIGKRYGFTLQMWSDMFFRLANGGDYYGSSTEQFDAIRKQIPENVKLVYWDYYSTDKARYDQMNVAHEKLQEGHAFAGGFWSWAGFAPHNTHSLQANRAALQSCREHGVKDVFFTMWGDNGGECSRFSLLPAMFQAAQLAAGVEDEEEIKAAFQKKFGLSFDDAMLMDLPNTLNGRDGIITAEKYLLYNDPLMGIFDATLSEGTAEEYAAEAKRLAAHADHPTLGYLFRSFQRLCELLACKAELGVHTRAAYDSKDRARVAAVLPEYDVCLERLAAFYDAYRTQWYRENKAQGFEVQDIRFGGLRQRLEDARRRLSDYAEGRIDTLEELDERLLPPWPGAEGTPVGFNAWGQIVSGNVIGATCIYP